MIEEVTRAFWWLDEFRFNQRVYQIFKKREQVFPCLDRDICKKLSNARLHLPTSVKHLHAQSEEPLLDSRVWPDKVGDPWSNDVSGFNTAFKCQVLIGQEVFH